MGQPLPGYAGKSHHPVRGDRPGGGRGSERNGNSPNRSDHGSGVVGTAPSSRTGEAETRETLVVQVSRSGWNGRPKRVRAPYAKTCAAGSGYLSTTGNVKACGNPGGPPSKAKYSWLPIAHSTVRER